MRVTKRMLLQENKLLRAECDALYADLVEEVEGSEANQEATDLRLRCAAALAQDQLDMAEELVAELAAPRHHWEAK